MEIPIRNYAHLGDAIWEVIVRKYTFDKNFDTKQLHNATTQRVNAKYQSDLFRFIEPMLTEEEAEYARRARNLSVPIGRRSIQAEYRLATAFEALIGYWYINDKERFEKMKNILTPKIEDVIG